MIYNSDVKIFLFKKLSFIIFLKGGEEDGKKKTCSKEEHNETDSETTLNEKTINQETGDQEASVTTETLEHSGSQSRTPQPRGFVFGEFGSALDRLKWCRIIGGVRRTGDERCGELKFRSSRKSQRRFTRGAIV